MLSPTQQFVIADPRHFDGNPYEVAERAVRQAQAVAKLLSQTVESARIMARNAEMERQLHFDGDCDASAFENGPHGRKFEEVRDAAEAAVQALDVLSRVAAFNPKGRLDG